MELYYFVISYEERESEKNRIVYITEALCRTPKTNTTLYTNFTSKKKKKQQRSWAQGSGHMSPPASHWCPN